MDEQEKLIYALGYVSRGAEFALATLQRYRSDLKFARKRVAAGEADPVEVAFCDFAGKEAARGSCPACNAVAVVGGRCLGCGTERKEN